MCVTIFYTCLATLAVCVDNMFKKLWKMFKILFLKMARERRLLLLLLSFLLAAGLFKSRNKNYDLTTTFPKIFYK